MLTWWRECGLLAAVKTETSKLQVWSCGGGTQSCAIGALIVQGRLPKPDVCVIADTGRETRTTWEYLDGTLNPALRSVGLEVVRIGAEQWTPRRNGIDLFDRKRTKELLIPVFSTRFSGPDDPNKLKAICSGNWKKEAIYSWFSKVLGVTRSHLVSWIGFSRDEQRRWVRLMQSEDFKAGLVRLPIVHDVPMTRAECISLVESMGWPTPPRSACWMCPNHSDHEWRKLISERPDEFQKAVELEREIRAVDPDAWLHRSCVPLDQVDFSQPEDLFSRPCDSGMCFV